MQNDCEFDGESCPHRETCAYAAAKAKQAREEARIETRFAFLTVEATIIAAVFVVAWLVGQWR